MEAMRKMGAAVRSRFDHAPYVSDEQEEQPVKASSVVDPSAALVDPDNENFMPSSREELKMAVQAMLSDIDNLEVPRTYQLIKKSIDKMREEQEMKKLSAVDESIIRREIRKILNEAPAKPVPQVDNKLMIDQYADDPEFVSLVVNFMPSELTAKETESDKKKKLVNLQKQVERKLKSKGIRDNVELTATEIIDKILDPLNAAARDDYLSKHDVTMLEPGASNAYGPGDPAWERDVESLRKTLQAMSFDDTEKGVKKQVDTSITKAAGSILRDLSKGIKDPVNSVKKTARWLKDNATGDVAENLRLVIDAVKEVDSKFAEDMLSAIEAAPKLVPKGKEASTGDKSRDELAKAFKLKYGTNIRAIEQKAMQKFKSTSSFEGGMPELKDEVQVLILQALQDFLTIADRELAGQTKKKVISRVYDEDILNLINTNIQSNSDLAIDIALELGVFRVFFDSYFDVIKEDPEDPMLRQAAATSGLNGLDKELNNLSAGMPSEFDTGDDEEFSDEMPTPKKNSRKK